MWPLPPVVMPLITARSDAPQQIIVHSSNQRHTGTLDFRRGKMFNSAEFLRHFEEKRIEEFCRTMVLFQKLTQQIGKFFLNFFNLARIVPLLRTPIALTQKLLQNTYYLQLSGWNNWFDVVITIFAQHEHLQSKIGEMTLSFAPTWRRVRQQLLMGLWFWTFCCNCKPVDNSLWPWKDKFGMISETCNRQKSVSKNAKRYLKNWLKIYPYKWRSIYFNNML